MTPISVKEFYCLVAFLNLFNVIYSQEPSNKEAFQLAVTNMKKDLAEVEQSVNNAPNFEMTEYFDETSTWQLLPSNTFRSQLLDCSVKLGYLAYQHLFFDQFADYLPDQVFYATLNTQYINDNFSVHEKDCKIWVKNKLYMTNLNCADALPAVCLTPTPVSRTDALLHNLVRHMFLTEVKSFQQVLDNTAEIISQETSAPFQDNWFGSTLVQIGEALRGNKALIAGQSSLFKHSTLGDFQRLKFQAYGLVQRVLVVSLQSWGLLQQAINRLPTNTQSVLNQTNDYLQELSQVKQELNRVKVSLDKASLQSDCQPCSPPPPQNATGAFCDSFFETCQTDIFPSERSMSIKKLIKYSFLNFYLNFSWAVLMFLILVISAIYTYKQHFKVKRLAEQVRTPITKYREEEPLVDMDRLGRVLNRQ